MDWQPPAGWAVAQLRKSKPCSRCGRTLLSEDVALLTKIARRWRFRCVDVEDCNAVVAWGGEPIFRKKLTQLAASMEQARR